MVWLGLTDVGVGCTWIFSSPSRLSSAAYYGEKRVAEVLGFSGSAQMRVWGVVALILGVALIGTIIKRQWQSAFVMCCALAGFWGFLASTFEASFWYQSNASQYGALVAALVGLFHAFLAQGVRSDPSR